MPNSEWDKLAEETLDLWQEYLASYTTDPKAKEELVKLVAPLQQMFAPWATMMQNAAYAPNTPSPDKNTAPTGNSTDALSVDQLAERVASLERQLAELESELAGGNADPTGDASTGNPPTYGSLRTGVEKTATTGRRRKTSRSDP